MEYRKKGKTLKTKTGIYIGKNKISLFQLIVICNTNIFN